MTPVDKFKEISSAWITSFNPTTEQKLISEERMNICDKCEYKEYNNLFDTYLCSRCLCPLNKKIFSPHKEACPISKWLK